jgi:hypothetical protein
MKNTLGFYEFSSWFEQNRPNNFSREGLKSLFEYLEQYEADCGTELDFDPIALCCEYTEYDDLGEFHQNYDHERYPDEDAIMDCTTLIKVGGTSFIIQNF